jgi:uncharacterized protein YaiL (DUF2058 family)
VQSLRDQLLAKGIASKKDARRVDVQLREERRHRQANQRPKAEIEAEQQAARLAAEQEAVRRRQQERLAREAARAEAERQQQVRQIILHHRIRAHGKVRFHHRRLIVAGDAGAPRIGRIEVHERVAWKLRCGEAAIAALTVDDYAVVSARAAQRLDEIAPGTVVHWVRDTQGLSAPEEGFLIPAWEISLQPRRLPG